MNFRRRCRIQDLGTLHQRRRVNELTFSTGQNTSTAVRREALRFVLLRLVTAARVVLNRDDSLRRTQAMNRTCIEESNGEVVRRGRWGLCSLTFELSGRERQDASARAVRMYRVPPAGRWWPAVGAPLERGVRHQLAPRGRVAPSPFTVCWVVDAIVQRHWF